MLPSGPIINNNRPHRHPAGFTTLSPHAAAFVPSSALWQHHPPAAAAAAPPPFSLPSACPTTSSNAAISHYSRPDWNSYRQPTSSSVASPSPSSPAGSCSTIGSYSNSSLTGEIYQPSRHQPDTSPHQKCSCKLLVTHKQAGAIIGKSGSEISQIEQAAKVSIKVSPSGCFFPGTQERVLVIFGESMNIREALQDITSKFEYCNEILQVQEETKSPYFRDWDESCTGVGCRARPLVMRLVVPNSAVGVLMGQHGSEIKSLAVGCGVHIQISPRIHGLVERVVSINGTSSRVLVAACEIMDAIQGNPHLFEHAINLTYSQQQHRAARSSGSLQGLGSLSTASNASEGDTVHYTKTRTMMRCGSNSLDSNNSHHSATHTLESTTTTTVVQQENVGEEGVRASRGNHLTARQLQLLIDALMTTLGAKGEGYQGDIMEEVNDGALFTLSSLEALGSPSVSG